MGKFNITWYVAAVKSFRGLVVVGIFLSISWLIYDILQNKQKHASNMLLGNLPQSITRDSYAEAPKLYGYDEKNNSYYVQAEKGIQKGKDLFHLESVYSQYILSDKSIVGVLGNTADIDMQRNELRTDGSVIVTYNDDYSLAADTVLFDYKKNTVKGEGSITLQSDRVQIYSSNFTVTDDFQNIEFESPENRVKTILKPTS